MKSKLLVVTLSFSASLALHAQVVSWNYDANGTIPTDSSSFAGVVSVANWNNSYPANPVTDLIDNSGNATTLDIALTYYVPYSVQGGHPGVDGDGTYNKELLNGYMNAGAGNGVSSVAFSQIPYSLYDIYVYFNSDTAGRTGTVTDGATTFSLSAVGSASISGANAVFTQTTDTGSGNPTADYAVFSGLSGASQNVTVDIPAYGGIAGFQIVAVPEPGTLALASLGGLGMMMFRRRR